MTTSSSDGANQPASTQSQDGLWKVCPVCKQLNPASVFYCQHCWGASLHGAKPMTRAEADNFIEQWKKTTRRRRNIRIAVIGVVSIILFLLVGSWYRLQLHRSIVGTGQATDCRLTPLGSGQRFTTILTGRAVRITVLFRLRVR